jgi:hypothetical protein
MTELERALVALGGELDFPPEPNLLPAVSARLGRRRPGFRPPLAFAVAVLVVAFGIAMAVPQARSAILRFFHIGAVTVERVDTLPPAQQRPLSAGLGPALSREAAEQRAQLAIKLPGHVEPTRFYGQPGLIATLLHYRGKAVLLAEMRGDQVSIVKKLAGPGTRMEGADLGEFGLWIEGGPHVLRWNFGSGQERQIQTRLAGNVLIWLQDDRTYRLEGNLDKAQLQELARDITR